MVVDGKKDACELFQTGPTSTAIARAGDDELGKDVVHVPVVPPCIFFAFDVFVKYTLEMLRVVGGAFS